MSSQLLERAIVDFSGLRGMFGDDDAMLASVVEVFLEDLPRLMADLREALAAEDAAGLRLAAHALRGSMSHFGAAACDLAGILEVMGQTGQLHSAPALFVDLEGAVERLRRVLVTRLNQLDA